MSESDKFENRLAKEKSPYLLQHAANPVEWYPWGDAAFKAAKEQDKPIFLSIGYATCHWCHVMEKESFENLEIAKLMNQAFINIKVDREEMPEIDALYMDFAQSLMAGSAGWPLNLILTPELYPFFAATYLPAVQKGGHLGMKELILRVQEIWNGEEREKLLVQAEKIVDVYSQHAVVQQEDLPAIHVVKGGAELIFKMADPIYGGLKGAPKFPVGYQYNFLLMLSKFYQDSRSQFFVERTLDMMHRGGIFDHIGGGFSRYSVDEKWLIPHFEKMLYDNALLVDAYVSAWKITKKDLYKDVAKQVLDYVLRELTSKNGAFYSAEDSDSLGVEGLYYTWTQKEIIDILGEEKGKLFASYYGAIPEGNFHGRNVLNTPLALEEFAVKVKIDPALLHEEIQKGKKKLFEAREKRAHPFKDDKILTSWNGLMIHAMAEAGSAFSGQVYMEAAKNGVQFILQNLYHDKILYRRFRDGEFEHRANLDDYAFFIRALITLFEKGEGEKYLTIALELTETVLANFNNPVGAFFQNDGADTSIILKKVYLTDGAEPSGNAIFCEDLLRLYHLTFLEKYKTFALSILKSVSPYFEQMPAGYFYHLMNLAYYLNEEAETFIVAFNKQNSYLDEIKNAFGETFAPHRSVIFVPFERNTLMQQIPWIMEYMPQNDKTTLYRCTAGKCLKSVTKLSEMMETIST